MKINLKHLIIYSLLLIFLVALIVYTINVVLDLSTTKVRGTKDWAEIEAEDDFDFLAMRNPPEKYEAILVLDEDMRIRVSDYMKRNNLRLKEGKQSFIKTNPTYEELIYDSQNYGFEFVSSK